MQKWEYVFEVTGTKVRKILFSSILFNPFNTLLNVIKKSQINERFYRTGQFPPSEVTEHVKQDFKNLGNFSSSKHKHMPVVKADCLARAQYLIQKSEELKCICLD